MLRDKQHELNRRDAELQCREFRLLERETATGADGQRVRELSNREVTMPSGKNGRCKCRKVNATLFPTYNKLDQIWVEIPLFLTNTKLVARLIC